MVITHIFNTTPHFESEMNVTTIEVSGFLEDRDTELLNYSLKTKQASQDSTALSRGRVAPALGAPEWPHLPHLSESWSPQLPGRLV